MGGEGELEAAAEGEGGDCGDCGDLEVGEVGEGAAEVGEELGRSGDAVSIEAEREAEGGGEEEVKANRIGTD